MKRIILFLFAVVLVLSMAITAYAKPIKSTESLFYFYDAEDDLPLYDVYLTNVELSFEAIGDIEAMKATVLDENDPHFRMNGSEILTSLNYEDEDYTYVAIFYYYQAELTEVQARQAQFVMNISGGTRDWICLDFDLKCNEWALQTFDLSLVEKNITTVSVSQIGINLKGSINGGKGYPNEAMFVKYIGFFRTAEEAKISTVESMKALYDYENGIGLATNPPVKDESTNPPVKDEPTSLLVNTESPTVVPTASSKPLEKLNGSKVGILLGVFLGVVGLTGVIIAVYFKKKSKID